MHIQPLLDNLQNMLVFPAGNPSFLAGGTAIFEGSVRFQSRDLRG
jgi:hypothetical protein